MRFIAVLALAASAFALDMPAGLGNMFGAVDFWWAKVFGFRLDERLGRIFFWLFWSGSVFVFVPMYALGFLGMTRRLDYIAHPGWWPLLMLEVLGVGLYVASVLAFLLQIAVQGAWGVVPVHLNELSPPGARGAFPGTAYQLGNLLAAGNAVLQGRLAEARHDNYAFALAVVAGVTAVALALLTLLGPEAKGVSFIADEFDSPA